MTAFSYHVTYALRVNLHSVIPLQSLKLQKSGLFQARSSLIFRQLRTKCRLTLCDMIHVCDMIQKDSKLHHTDKYSQHSLIIWPVWLNGWVFIYELSACGFESHCSPVISFRRRKDITYKETSMYPFFLLYDVEWLN